MKLNVTNKILLVASYGCILLGALCLWAGIEWVRRSGGVLGLHLILYILAISLPIIGLLNARRIYREHSKDDNIKSPDEKQEG